jgi:hypothetical protein
VLDITASATTSLSPEQVIRAAADFMTSGVSPGCHAVDVPS